MLNLAHEWTFCRGVRGRANLIFESGKKKDLRIQKYPDTCGQGLNEVQLFD